MRMTIKAALVFLALAPPVAADQIDDLAAALEIEALMAILQKEGAEHADQLAQTLFEGEIGADWGRIVAEIYAPDKMLVLTEMALRDSLVGKASALPPMLRYFSSEPGARLIDSEIAARAAYLDADVKERAEAAFAQMEAAAPPRLALLEEIDRVNGLVERNVAGAMNSNLAFMRGLNTSLPPEAQLPPEETVADLWAQAETLHAETRAWLMPYLALAYSGLSDAEVEGYRAFSASAEGQILNRALFDSFERLYDQLSFQTGRAAGLYLQGQTI